MKFLFPFLLSGSLWAQPALPSITMAWDYPSTVPASFLLLWGTNSLPTGTNTRGTVLLAPPSIYTFHAVATNLYGSATSLSARVLVVRVHLETSSSLLGPWSSKTIIYDVSQIYSTNEFFRARVDIQ